MIFASVLAEFWQFTDYTKTTPPESRYAPPPRALSAEKRCYQIPHAVQKTKNVSHNVKFAHQCSAPDLCLLLFLGHPCDPNIDGRISLYDRVSNFAAVVI